MSAEMFLCISSKMSIVFKGFVTGGEATRGNFLYCPVLSYELQILPLTLPFKRRR